MDLVFLGDTHEMHREVNVPAGDILICTGDFMMFSRDLAVVEDVNAWLGELPHAWKIVVPGNHEHFLEVDASRRRLLDNATVLLDETISIEGLNIYGSPWTPQFGSAFAMPSARDRRRHWATVPEDTHVLVTHGPPFGILDHAPTHPESMGDPQLGDRIRELRSLRISAFGHVHQGYGMKEDKNVLFINAALMGAHGGIDRSPIAVRLAERSPRRRALRQHPDRDARDPTR